MTTSRYVKKEIKEELKEIKICFYCNRKVRHRTEKDEKRKFYVNAIEYDHLRPFSKGGKTDIANMRVACAKCNRRKHNKSAFQFEKKTFGRPRCQQIVGNNYERCVFFVKKGNKKFCEKHSKTTAKNTMENQFQKESLWFRDFFGTPPPSASATCGL
jgi:hypothetical protein